MIPGPREGIRWVKVNGLYYDDLFEVPIGTPEEEIADARRQYRNRYPNRCVIKSVERIITKEEHNATPTMPA